MVKLTRVKALQNLADLLQPGMLGLSKEHYVFLYRSKNPYDPRLKTLEEMGWYILKDRSDVRWTYPTLEAYNSLIEVGLEFTPSVRVDRWVAQTVSMPKPNHYQEAILASSPLFDYQKEGALFLYAHHRAMLSLSPGLGKSIVSIYAAALSEETSFLVVSPASLLYTWKSEIEKWSKYIGTAPEIEIWHRQIGEAPMYMDYGRQFWAIINPETMVKYVDKLVVNNRWGAMIVDESSMYKNRSSLRSNALASLAVDMERVWLLTGTPATRYLDDMWHQFHILSPQGYSSYWRFAERYCVIHEDQWGKKVVANQRQAEKQIKKNFADIYFARNQDEVSNIPDWLFEDLDIPMTKEQDRVYDKLRKELLIVLSESDPTQNIKINNHLSLVIRSIQIASNPVLVEARNTSGKWDALPELLEIYPGPHLVWVNFIQTGVLLRERLSKTGRKVVFVNGSTSLSDRNDIVDTFQRGEIDVLIMNAQVGKFGFTLTKARTAFFVERMYDDSYFQCLYRNRRIGTTQSPIIVHLRSVTQKGHMTIDHVIHDVLDYRTGMIKEITTGKLLQIFRDENRDEPDGIPERLQ